MYRCLAVEFGPVLSHNESLHVLRSIFRLVPGSELPIIIHSAALCIRLKYRKDEAHSRHFHVFGLWIHFQHGET